jgi:magnesium transporter
MTPVPTDSISPAQLRDPVLTYVRRDIVRLHPRQSVRLALESVRGQRADDRILYFYVVDDDERLVGVVPARRLLTSDPNAEIETLMVDDVIAIPAQATVLIAAEYFINRRLLAFPVVEDDGRLVGVVDVQLFTNEVLNFARESLEDLFQIIGVHATQADSAWRAFRDRFPWLLTNIAGGLICAFVTSQYEELLRVVVVLALFIPVVLALSESVSIQSVTLTLQSLHSGRLNMRFFMRALRHELATATLLGIGCGGTVALVILVWQHEPRLALAIGGAIALSMVTACLLGVILPSTLRMLDKDPKIAAGPIVLATADVATLLFYFNLARLLVR